MTLPTAATVAAVIVHYRTPERLSACLAALARQTLPLADVVVLDNSFPSTIDSPARDAGWRLHRSDANVGFGAACNLGASDTDSDYVLMLNADVLLAEDACERLLEYAKAHPATAVVGPSIVGSDGRVELSAREFPSPLTGLLGRSSLLTALLRRVGVAPPGVAAALGGDSRAVDWVSGACMLVLRRAFEQVEGFDSGYWMYWEDADLCRRLRDREWMTGLCVQAHARHATGSSGRSERSIRAFHDSAARYYAQHLARSPIDARLARLLLHARRIAVARGA